MSSLATGNEGRNIEEAAGSAEEAFNALWPNTLSEEEQRFIVALVDEYMSRRGVNDAVRGYVIGEFINAYVLLRTLDAKRAPGVKFSVFVEVARAMNALWSFVDRQGHESYAVVRGEDDVLYLVEFRERTFTIEGIVNPVTEDCAVSGVSKRGKRYYTRLRCLVVDAVYRLNNLVDVMRVNDTVLHANFYVARVRNGVNTEVYVFDHSSTAFTEGLLSIGVAARRDVIDKLRTALAARSSAVFHFTTGFIYDPARNAIYWEPGYAGIEVRQAGRDEVVTELMRFRGVLDTVKGGFRDPATPMQVIGLYYAYSFYQAYRYLLGNADTPVPLIFGYPNLNKTTVLNALRRTLNIGDAPITLSTEGAAITLSPQRLIAAMTETTLPLILDDVTINDRVVELILQLGAAGGDSVSLPRARQYGPGLRERLPIVRMGFFILNADSVNDVYGGVIDVLRERGRGRVGKAVLMAILERRLLPLDFNRAGSTSIELRRSLQSVELPNMLLVLNHVVANYPGVLIRLMRQEVDEVKDKYLNFLWFTYLFWRFIHGEFGVDLSDLVDAMRRLAEEREEAGRYRVIVMGEEIEEGIRREDAERVRATFETWIEDLNIQAETASERLTALVRNADRARVVFAQPRWSNESIENASRIVNLICENEDAMSADGTIDPNNCNRRSTIFDDEFIKVVNELLRQNKTVVYLLDHAFASRSNRNGIGVPRTLMGRQRTRVGNDHGFRLTLDELLSILFNIDVEHEQGSENPGDKLNTANTYTPTSTGAIEGSSSSGGEEGVRLSIPNEQTNKVETTNIGAGQVGEVGTAVSSSTPGSSEKVSDKIGVEGSGEKLRVKVRWGDIKGRL
ncbi:hypothetical protein [Vulcanisaeta souniana]|nr:hypothetical protein [Vulcanisaeta souniana]